MAKKNRGNVANGENTVIGAGTTVNGDIVSDSAVIRVDGQVNGGINTKGDLVVGSMGVINGDVVASSVNLAGKIDGDVDAANKIEIEAKGKLLGNIRTKLLAMDEAAFIQGNVNMTPEEIEKEKDRKDKEDSKDDSDDPKEDEDTDDTKDDESEEE